MRQKKNVLMMITKMNKKYNDCNRALETTGKYSSESKELINDFVKNEKKILKIC